MSADHRSEDRSDSATALAEYSGHSLYRSKPTAGTGTVPDDDADRPSLKRQGLFPCEAEIARRLSQSEKRWRGVARVLERDGLPKIDPVMGGRFWPAVVAFFQARYGVGPVHAVGSVTVVQGPPDREEHWDAF
jgi:hypothetical protein